MASTSGSIKRKHKTLTLPEKYEIIKRHDRGETPTAISQVFGIGWPTVYDIVKNRGKIEKNLMKFVDNESKTKTLKMRLFILGLSIKETGTRPFLGMFWKRKLNSFIVR